MTLTMDFTDKHVFVFGGTSGINRGVAEAYAQAGAKVCVASRSQEKVDDTVAALKALGAKAAGFSVDVRDAEGVCAAFASAAETFGEVDIVVSGAAGNFPATAMGMSANGFKSVVDIDLLGTFHVMQAAFPHLRKPGASIVNISAPQAFIPMEAQSHVCAAKAGVDMITRVLAMEWGPKGVRVNSICPGPIDGTEGMARLAPTEEARQACINSVPMRRMGVPQDIANACMFLASPLGNYINGVVLPVDGGWAQNCAGGMSSSLAQFAREMEAKH